MSLVQQHIRLLQRIPRKNHDPQRRRWRGMFADGRKSLDITPVIKKMPFFRPIKIRFRIFGSYRYKSTHLISAISIKKLYLNILLIDLINKFKNNGLNRN